MLGPLRALLPPVLTVLGLAYVAHRSGIDATVLFDPGTAAAVAAIPWAVLAFSDSWRAAGRAARDLASGRTAELSAPQSYALEMRLRSVGAATIGIGVFAAILALVGGMNEIARTQGQADVSSWPLVYGGYLLGPAYALLIDATLYGPTRARLRSERIGSTRGQEPAR